MTKRIASFVAIIAVLAGLGWVLADNNMRPQSQELQTTQQRLVPVTTQVAAPVESITTQRTFTGRVVAARASDLSFEISGSVESIAVDEGTHVMQGQALAQLDMRKQAAQRQQLIAQRDAAQAKLDEMIAGPRRQTIDAARANVSDLQAQLELLKARKRRREELLNKNVISRDEFDDVDFARQATEARLDSARHGLDELLEGTRKEQIEAQRAAVQQLQASIDEVDVVISQGELRAPYSGTVVARYCDEGKVAVPGDPVLRLIEDSALEIHVGVAHDTAATLESDSRHTVLIGDHEISARVKAVLPELDAATRTRKVILVLDQSSGIDAVHEQVARLQVAETIDADGYWLPTDALVKGLRGLWSCYVVADPSEKDIELAAAGPGVKRIERRDVEVLHIENDRALVRGTIQAGDRIVTEGTHRVVDDQLVRVMELVSSEVPAGR